MISSVIFFIILFLIINIIVNSTKKHYLQIEEEKKSYDELSKELDLYIYDNCYKKIIETGQAMIDCCWQKDSAFNRADFYEFNRNNDHDRIIFVSDKILDYVSNSKQIILEHTSEEDINEDLDFFYYWRAISHEMKENYELAIADYETSNKLVNDNELDERIKICKEKLKG